MDDTSHSLKPWLTFAGGVLVIVVLYWAQAMGHTDAAKLLQQTLDEEKAADKKLSGLAEGGINKGAAGAAHAVLLERGGARAHPEV